MPELPEVQRVCSTVAPHLTGRRVTAVSLRFPGIVEGPRDAAALLVGQTFAPVQRLGKQILLATAGDGPCVCVHLGMTGSLRWQPGVPAEGWPAHTHLVWSLDDGSVLSFRDPRRFGGVWTFACRQDLLERRWRELGPDALAITPSALHRGLCTSKRPLKAALLDQSLVAGLGNIYVDELLFAARVHPLTPCTDVDKRLTSCLVGRMRTLLARAIAAGGSTLRDYVDADGDTGGYQLRHRVYGRSGQKCVRCRTPLATLQVGGRTTVCCPACQPEPRVTRRATRRR
jgi:formamidopyrimidine-DNA glycosylase